MGTQEPQSHGLASGVTLFSWRAVRAADGAGLENQWAEMPRGFESHALRAESVRSGGRFLSVLETCCLDNPDPCFIVAQRGQGSLTVG